MHDFADTCAAVAATTRRLKKAALLQDYFARLSDGDMALAARYLSGRAFPLSDQRVLGVGYAQVRDAILTLVPTPAEECNRLPVQLGDMGEVAYELLRRRVPTADDGPPTADHGPPTADGESMAVGGRRSAVGFSLQDTAVLFDALAGASGARAKVKLLVDALGRTTASEARYLVKIIMGELRVGLQEGQVEDALARAYGVPVAQVQWANMLLGDLGETAVLARHKRLAEAQMHLFHPLKFMLASPTESSADVARLLPNGFYVEDKYDGVRDQVHKQSDRVAMYSRTLDEVGHRYPELHAALLALPGEFILDGEVLGMRDGRAIPFTEFQPRLGRKTVDAELLAALPVVFVAYDILYQDGEVLLEKPFHDRRSRLTDLLRIEDRGLKEADGQSSILNPLSSILLAPSVLHHDADELPVAFEAARERGNEGLMVKAPEATYKPGRRGKEWLKVKRPLATLDVVVTGVEWGNGKRRHVLSDYTFAVRADDGSLVEVGKAYSGLTDAEIAELTEWFKAHTLRDYGRFRHVEPCIILEVAFDNVQASTRHASGYALRFPRIVRIRDDKPLDEIDTVQTVRQLASQASKAEENED